MRSKKNGKKNPDNGHGAANAAGFGWRNGG
jgi:hypothetical protein